MKKYTRNRYRQYFKQFNSILPWPHLILLGFIVLLVSIIYNNPPHPTSPSLEPDLANEMLNSTVNDSTGFIPSMADQNPRILGYASATSVRQGNSIKFHISAQTNNLTYDIHIYRAGASGSALMMTVTDMVGTHYNCGPAGVPVGLENTVLGCNWPVAYTLNVPSNWPSGIYIVDLLDEDDQPGNYGSYILFTVTEDQPGSTSDILFHVPTATWNAYNMYGGWGLYTDPQAVEITLDRPMDKCTIYTACHSLWELPMVRWLESNGYTVEYATSQDIHNNSSLLFNYKLFMSVGHDEYWTKEMRDQLDNFIDSGGNYAAFSANTIYRQIRYEDNGRTIIGYKDFYKDDPLKGVDNIRVATRFGRPYNPGWPQNSTTGLGWTGWANKNGQYTGEFTVYRSSHWVYEGTGLSDGDEFWHEPTEEVEVDGAEFVWENGLPVVTGAEETPLNFLILGVGPASQANKYTTMGVYSRTGGGTVFNAATYAWPRALLEEYNPESFGIVGQITRNVLAKLTDNQSPPPPTFAVQDASFIFQPSQVISGDTVTFVANITPSYATPPITYNWDFDDGSNDQTNSSTIAHTYAAAGTYTVILDASNPYGQHSYNQQIIVESQSTGSGSNQVFLPVIIK